MYKIDNQEVTIDEFKTLLKPTKSIINIFFIFYLFSFIPLFYNNTFIKFIFSSDIKFI
jgi:hypothetical protein